MTIARQFCITILFFALLSGCAMPPKRVAETSSGRPEVTINTTDLDLVKSEIINQMQSGNFFLQDDSKYRLLFTKEMEGGQAVMAQMLVGNSYSTTPVAEIAFNLSKQGNSIKVIEFSSFSTQMAFGQVNRQDMKGNNAWFNDFYNILQRVKYNVESSQ